MRVLFLGGLGRSGTTLVERVLSQLPGVVALGEVVHLWERSLINDEPCGCGAPFSKCAFWRRVGEVAFGGWAAVDAEHVLALRRSVDRTRFIPQLSRGRSRPAPADLAEYLSYYQRLYEAAALVSGADLVLDSSKHASLAFCLRHAPDVDLHVVHCVRDSRAVAYSWTKQVPRPESAVGEKLMTRYTPATSALKWNADNAAFSLLRRLGTPTFLLRYEEFVAAPRTATREIAAFAGTQVADPDLSFLGDREVDLAVAHTASGNPLRFRTGLIPIRVDNAWRESFPRLQQRLVTALTLPLLARYGYVRTLRRAPARDPGKSADARATPTLPGSPVGAPAAGQSPAGLPSVGVIIPTRDRPELLRAAVEAVLAQDYAGPLRVIVVYDRVEPDPDTARPDGPRRVDVLTNSRASGLAGTRNTGILATDTTLIAFCDDDDEWLPGKLSAQVDALLARPDAEFCTCSIVVDFDGLTNPRNAGTDTVTHEHLLRSRMAMLHSSTFVLRRNALIDGIGLVNEEVPGGQNEDWDLLLRASARQPIVHVDRPLVRVRWGRTSFFAQQRQTKIASLEWMLDEHQDIGANPVGAARVFGQLAFAHACLGERRVARRWARRALRHRLREWRAVVALAVSARLITGPTVLRVLHKFGRGV